MKGALYCAAFLITSIFLILSFTFINLTSATRREMGTKDKIYKFFERREKKGMLRGRRASLPTRRRPLPADLFSGSRAKLECGSYHSVTARGHISFKMNSPDEECSQAFIGSRTENCTVAILCQNMALTPSSCREGYFELFDGTKGFQKGCGNVFFDGIPRIARNGGNDIYFKYKGTAGDSVCAAFCKEDLRDEHLKSNQVRKPIKIKKSLLYKRPAIDSSCTCGTNRKQANSTPIQGRVVGGEDSEAFEFPWLGVMTLSDIYQEYIPGVSRITLCGSSLVSDRHVVSAAHCLFAWKILEPEDLSIVFHTNVMGFLPAGQDQGDESKYKETVHGYELPVPTDEEEGSVRRAVQKVDIHPLYTDGAGYDWDVAVLTLAEPVDIRDAKTTPICLPTTGKYLQYPSNIKHTVAGYGFLHEDDPAGSKILQKLDVAPSQCLPKHEASLRHLCFGTIEGGEDACKGDSGGPLIYFSKPESNQYMLSGVVSSGIGCARKGLLGLYTNVQEVIQWINLKMANTEHIYCSP